jgi:nucleotide exchange factor SIL1
LLRTCLQLSSPESSDEERHNALVAIQILVEPIDNANDLETLGGVAPLVDALGSPNATLRAGKSLSTRPSFV